MVPDWNFTTGFLHCVVTTHSSVSIILYTLLFATEWEKHWTVGIHVNAQRIKYSNRSPASSIPLCNL